MIKYVLSDTDIVYLDVKNMWAWYKEELLYDYLILNKYQIIKLGKQ